MIVAATKEWFMSAIKSNHSLPIDSEITIPSSVVENARWRPFRGVNNGLFEAIAKGWDPKVRCGGLEKCVRKMKTRTYHEGVSHCEVIVEESHCDLVGVGNYLKARVTRWCAVPKRSVQDDGNQ